MLAAQSATLVASASVRAAWYETTPRTTSLSPMRKPEFCARHVSRSRPASSITMATAFAGTRPASRFVCHESGSSTSSTPAGSFRAAKTSVQAIQSSRFVSSGSPSWNCSAASAVAASCEVGEP